MPIIKAFENKPLNNLEGKPILDYQGFYRQTNHGNMQTAGCIAFFGADFCHLANAKTGIKTGSGQALGLQNYKYAAPIYTMSYADPTENFYKKEPDKAMQAMRYQFAEAETLHLLNLMMPMTKLKRDRDVQGTKVDDLKDRFHDKTKLQNASDEAKAWARKLKYGDKVVNMGFGICANPDFNLLCELNERVENFTQTEHPTLETMPSQMQYWNTHVLKNVALIGKGIYTVNAQGQLTGKDGSLIEDKPVDNTNTSKEQVTNVVVEQKQKPVVNKVDVTQQGVKTQVDVSKVKTQGVKTQDATPVVTVKKQEVKQQVVKQKQAVKTQGVKKEVKNKVKNKVAVEFSNEELLKALELRDILQKLRAGNAKFQRLTQKHVEKIFTDANAKGGYTRAIEYDKNADDDTKTMRQFSVAFQKECKGKKVLFSKTNTRNANGMRTKSAIDYVGGVENLEKAISMGWK